MSRIFAILRAAEKRRGGRESNASAAIVDSPSTKTTEEGGGSNGYDIHKNVKARKRHLLVDALGTPLSICVTPADVQDRAGALLLAGLKAPVSAWRRSGRTELMVVKVARWCEEQRGWDLEIVERNRKVSGFEVLPRRWIAERTWMAV